MRYTPEELWTNVYSWMYDINIVMDLCEDDVQYQLEVLDYFIIKMKDVVREQQEAAVEWSWHLEDVAHVNGINAEEWDQTYTYAWKHLASLKYESERVEAFNTLAEMLNVPVESRYELYIEIKETLPAALST
jgi:hypothetical protein